MTSVLLTIQKSNCKSIKCCGCECDRDPTLPVKYGEAPTQPWIRVVCSEYLSSTDQFKEGAWSDLLSFNQLGATIVDLDTTGYGSEVSDGCVSNTTP